MREFDNSIDGLKSSPIDGCANGKRNFAMVRKFQKSTDCAEFATRCAAKVCIQCTSLLVAVALVLSGGSSFEALCAAAAAAEQSGGGVRPESGRLSPGEISERGIRLRAELDKAFDALLDSGKANPANDLTTIVLPYIQAGMAFDDAENILRAAGFVVGPRPGPYEEQDPSRPKDWYAVVSTIRQFSRRVFGGSVEAYITLFPEGPHDYRKVKNVDATIYVQIS